ncbi:MAG: PAS domain S-box protein [Elusimicrobiales bacterium]|nr:PAS domain S-box protein [Elusimicrobiales bacterium]
MKRSGVKSQDKAAFGNILQAMLLTAFSPDNFDPFLKKIAALLSGPEGLGAGAKVAVLLKGENGRPLRCAAAGFSKGALAQLAGGARLHAAGGRFFSAPVCAGNAKVGRLAALLPAPPENPQAAAGMLEMAAKVVGARLTGEKRDAELNAEKDIADSVKHVEELYLAFPGISIEEISRAVLDEARRLTGSAFGFAAMIDPGTGFMNVASMTTETWDVCRMKEKPVIFKEFTGLWGWVLKHKKPLLSNKAGKDRRSSGTPRGHIKIDKFLAVPAMSGRKLLGILGLANPGADYGPADLDAAQKLARVYAIILQRKLAEDRQREEDSRFKAIIASSKDIIYTANLKGQITYISPQAREYGYEPEELLGRGVVQMAHPEDQDFVIKAFANAVSTGRTLPILPYRIRKKDNTYFYAEQKSGIVTRNGAPLYITGVIRDVTEQKKTDLLLKENEALLRMVFDTAKDAIFIKDMNGMYVKVNKACADIFGLTPEQMLYKRDSELFEPEAAAEIFKDDSDVVLSGKTLLLNKVRRLPAGTLHLSVVKTPLRDIRGRIIGVLGISRDISELKKMERELAISTAAAAVSKVARPMAHDFNNALAAINGYATLIEDGLTETSPIKTEIAQIIKAVKRAAELTSKFQDFARNPKLEEHGGGNV